MGKAMVPRRLFFTRGVGHHLERHTSFAMALFDAGLAPQTLLRVGAHGAAIFPPKAQLVSRNEGLENLQPGEVVYAILAENATCEPHRRLTASIGVAMPKDTGAHGCLAEYAAFGEIEEEAGASAEDRAAEMLATTLGIDFENEMIWDAKREIYRIDGSVIRTANVTQSATGDPRGLWTTTLAAAVMLFD